MILVIELFAKILYYLNILAIYIVFFNNRGDEFVRFGS